MKSPFLFCFHMFKEAFQLDVLWINASKSRFMEGEIDEKMTLFRGFSRSCRNVDGKSSRTISSKLNGTSNNTLFSRPPNKPERY